MGAPFIDIHTHKAQAKEGLLQIINLDLEQDCLEQGFYSYGIHPWQLDSADFQVEKALQPLKEKLKLPQVIALGEAGLDKFHKSDFGEQMRVFERQIVLSENLKKPMILHDVKSHNEIIALRKKHRAKQPWIVHGFNGTEQDVRQCIRQGFYLSVGESLLHPERKICKTLKSIDLDRLFLETDTAMIGIEKVYEAAASLLEIELEELKTHVFRNYIRIFRGPTRR